MKIINIIIKDLKIILSDKKALGIMILMPIILTTILSLALKGSFAGSGDVEIEPVKIAVVKLYDEVEDSEIFESSMNNNILANGMGEVAIKDLIDAGKDINIEEIFFKDFLESKDVSKFMSYRIEEESKAIDLLNNEDISAVVLLPQKYTYDMKINLLTPFRNKVDIKILTHPDRTIDGQIVKSIIDAYANAMSGVIIGKNVIIETAMTNNVGSEGFNNMDELMEGVNDLMNSININIEEVVLEGQKSINSADYYAIAMMTMFILFAAGQGGRMLLEEKDNLTYQRMVVAGTGKLEILSGKLITIFLIAIFQITVMIAFTHFALKVEWGDLNSVSLVSITAAFAVAGLGTFIGALTYVAGNYKMANIFESALIQVMALLGGSFFPIDIMPEIMQKLSFLSLNGIALKAYLKIIKGHGISEILNYILILVVTGAAFTRLAVMVLKRKEEDSDVKHNKVKTVKA